MRGWHNGQVPAELDKTADIPRVPPPCRLVGDKMGAAPMALPRQAPRHAGEQRCGWQCHLFEYQCGIITLGIVAVTVWASLRRR